MAVRASELDWMRSAYLRDLHKHNGAGLLNAPFEDSFPSPGALSAPPAIDHAKPGANAAAPRSAPEASATALYLQEAGDTSVISVNDINQGQLGDCFLLSAIGEIALWHPNAIINMICANPDGTETVTLNVAASGQLPTYSTTSFKTTTVTVNNAFPSNAVNNGANQDVVNGVKESGSRSWRRPLPRWTAVTTPLPAAAVRWLPWRSSPVSRQAGPHPVS